MDFMSLMEPVAVLLLGEPNSRLSTPPRQVRFGTHGSMSVNYEDGTFYDHETKLGGGVLDLIAQKIGADHGGAMTWLRKQGLKGTFPASQLKSSPTEPAVAGAPPRIERTYEYVDEAGALLFQVVRLDPKGFRQRRPDGKGGWNWRLGPGEYMRQGPSKGWLKFDTTKFASWPAGKERVKFNDVRRVLYRLPSLLKAVAEGHIIFVTEGERDADNLHTLGFAATTSPGGAGKWLSEYNQALAAADVVIIPDNDRAGHDHAEQVAASLHAVAKRIRVLDIGKHWAECPAKGDISDWLQSGGTADKLKELLAALPDWKPDGNDDSQQKDDQRIAALAELNGIAYQKGRTQAAAELGIPVGALDKLVRQCRAQADEDAASLPHWKVEPSPDPVDGAALLADIKSVFCRYIVLPKGAADALALWTLHAWTADAGDVSPFLVLVSPTKRCGKTSVLIILQYLTPRSELASNISASALFRYIEETRPTLLIDEADSFVKNNEEMRGILNSGHTKVAAYVIRNVDVNGEYKARRFSTWAPKAIATIRALADTLEDRSILVQLQRKPRTASVARLRKRDSDDFRSLRSRAARWAADNFRKLTDPDPSIPDALNDRAADNWGPLLAIADLAGGVWPQSGREAACFLSGEEQHAESVNVALLVAIKELFDQTTATEIASAAIVAKLTADPESRWYEWKGPGRPLTQNNLARLLRPFGITSETVHPANAPHAKGYKRERFEAAWESYLPGQTATAPPFQTPEVCKSASADETDTTHTFSSVQEIGSHASKNSKLPHSHAGLHGCTDQPEAKGVSKDKRQELWDEYDEPDEVRI
jgi:hypothetical protein